MPASSEPLQVAVAHYHAGQLADAEQACRQIIAAQPDSANAWHLLGLIAAHTRRQDIAVGHLQRAIALEPTNAEAHNNLGGVLMHQAAFERAEACFRSAIHLQPAFAVAHANLAKALYDQEKLAQSADAYRRAIELNSTAADLHNFLGNVLFELGDLHAAESSCRRAAALNPDDPETHNNLGRILWQQKRGPEATACFQRALTLRPDFAEAHANLANAHMDRGELDQAIDGYQRALTLKPDFAAVYNNLGTVFKLQAKLKEAIDCYRRAVELKPSFHRAHSNLVYTLLYSPDYDARAIHEEHCRWNEKHARALAQFIRPHSNDASPNRRLRIGYVSPYFCKHAQSFFIVPLFSSHDHQQVEVFCYSDVRRSDDVSDRLKSMADVWRDVSRLRDEEVAEQVRHDQIDILVDLTMHMAHGRLLVFAQKPAPVQVCWLAYPGTTGLDAIDYRLTDAHLDPPGWDGACYSEKTVQLPDAFWCYNPLTDTPSVNALPALHRNHITFGSLNNFCKVNDAVLKLWAGVLRAVDRSRIVILTDEGSHRERTARFLEEQGIDRSRIEFARLRLRPEYLKLYHELDIALDTFPYNGHTTSLDAFWMGVPVITFAGQTPVGRGGVSLLQNLGLPELIAMTPEAFISIAARLAGDPNLLSSLRQTLRERMQRSPLMDAPRFARSVEHAYRAIWQQWCNECGR